jgi:hypothetical protein
VTAERFHYGGGIRAQRRRLLIQVDRSGYAVAMRKGIEIDVSATDCARLEAIVADRNSPQKHVWRARIILATADGLRHRRGDAPRRRRQAQRLALAGALHARGRR